jgi:hypothetical protein
MNEASAPKSPFRVLSLDGGGTWAVIEALTLIRVFGPEARGHDVLARFDLAVANSGGSVILACLAVNKRLSEILDLYTDETKRRSTFQSTLCERFVSAVGGGRLPYPRYSTVAKGEALSIHLGQDANVPLQQWPTDHPRLANLVITAFDYDVERSTFFRTDSRSLAASQSSSSRPDVTLLHAVHASTTAPVLFFDKPAAVQLKNQPPRRYWDGAIAGYNNPVMVAAIEALAAQQASPSRPPLPGSGGEPRTRSRPIRILSVGTGTVHRPRRPPEDPLSDPRFIGREPSCVLADLQKLSGAIVDDPPDAATFMAHVVLGGLLPSDGHVVAEGPIVRMNPVVRPVFENDQWVWPTGLGDSRSRDVADAWLRLTRLGLDALAQEDIDLVIRLCDGWFAGGVRNQPIRPRDDTLDAEIGHDTFAGAYAALLRAFQWPPSTTQHQDEPRPQV